LPVYVRLFARSEPLPRDGSPTQNFLGAATLIAATSVSDASKTIRPDIPHPENRHAELCYRSHFPVPAIFAVVLSAFRYGTSHGPARLFRANPFNSPKQLERAPLRQAEEVLSCPILTHVINPTAMRRRRQIARSVMR
jgi:hypothetical protein